MSWLRICQDNKSWPTERHIKNQNALDIEGAEYVVLQEMIDQGVIGMIDRLFIEFHWDRIGMDLRSHHQLEQQLRRFGIPMEFWDALDDDPGSADLRE